MKVCLPYVNQVDFLLGWDIKNTGDRGRLPAGLFIRKQISYSSSATFFLIHLKAQLVLSLIVFTEHSHYTKHDTKALLSLNVKFCLKVKLLPLVLWKIVDLHIFLLN